MSPEPEVFTITGAASGTTDEQKGRQRRYLFSMGLRTVCFVGGILTTGVVRWVLIFGAVALPYFAVVIANAGRERGNWRGSENFIAPTNPALEAEDFRTH